SAEPISRSDSVSLSNRLGTEAVSSFPGPEGTAQIRHVDSRSEAREASGSVRERAQSETGGGIQCATAKRPVTVACIEDDVTVQQPGWDTRRLIVVDVRAGRDLQEI